uniref:EF-hand domain-containing protein n=1 Tax=Globodera pallida TaxID=36090 RepID=A0A183CAI1_GLOPA
MLRQQRKQFTCLFKFPPTNNLSLLIIRQRHGTEFEQPRVYWPGSGLRTKKEIEEEFKCARDGKYPAENVHDWTVTGRRNLTQQALFHYTDRQAGKGYSDFADPHYYSRPYIWPPLREMNRWYLVIFIVLAAFMLIDCEWFFASFRSLRKSEAATLEGDEAKGDDRQKRSSSENAKTGSSGTAINACSIEQSLNKKKSIIGFRERRIIEYENRIRAYSSPDKIFRYFATIKLSYEDGSSDIFMTPEDFVRSLTPGVMQPRRYGLDKYKMFNAAEMNMHSPRDSVFNWMSDSGGLINFGDYLFLMTLLSTSPSEFKLAFHVFDQNGDGVLDQQEFARVQELVLSQSNIGQRHRDHKTGTGAFVRTKNSMLSKHFFGEDGRKKLDIETFLRFQIEFERRDPESGPEGIISELSFAELLMIHSDLPEKRQKRMLKRADNFFAFIYHIDKVDLALHFYKLAGKPLSKQLLQRVARKVTGVDLSDTVVDVAVTLFDENGDGELSQREFVFIMKKRMQRGLERPKDTGLFRLMDAYWQCAARFVREGQSWGRC